MKKKRIYFSISFSKNFFYQVYSKKQYYNKSDFLAASQSGAQQPAIKTPEKSLKNTISHVVYRKTRNKNKKKGRTFFRKERGPRNFLSAEGGDLPGRKGNNL